MRTGLKLAGLAIIFVTVAFWFFGGMNRGWNKSFVTTTAVDPVTELEYQVEEKRFVPGVEFLAGGIGAGFAVMGLSFFVRKRA